MMRRRPRAAPRCDAAVMLRRLTGEPAVVAMLTIAYGSCSSTTMFHDDGHAAYAPLFYTMAAASAWRRHAPGAHLPPPAAAVARCRQRHASPRPIHASKRSRCARRDTASAHAAIMRAARGSTRRSMPSPPSPRYRAVVIRVPRLQRHVVKRGRYCATPRAAPGRCQPNHAAMPVQEKSVRPPATPLSAAASRPRLLPPPPVVFAARRGGNAARQPSR